MSQPLRRRLEEFMEHVIFPREAVRRADNGELAIQPKPGYLPNDFISWKRSGDAAAIRKLYFFAK